LYTYTFIYYIMDESRFTKNEDERIPDDLTHIQQVPLGLPRVHR
jgi:hypothetical protein